MDSNFDLEAKPLSKALIFSAVRSVDPQAGQYAEGMPTTHRDLLRFGITSTAKDISDTAFLLLGRSKISSSEVLPEEAPVVIGFSLFIMLGMIQAVSKEGIFVDVPELTEDLIEQHLRQRYRIAENDPAVKKEILEVSRVATQIPIQIVETAQGEVEELFSRCYSVIPAYVQGGDEARRQIMPIFGTSLHVLLQSQVKPDH